MVIETKMIADARNEVLKTGDFLSAVQVAEIAGFSKTNPSGLLNEWRKDSAIFAVNQNGVDLDLFPRYALDPTNKYRPYKLVGEVIKVFANLKDGWGLAYWFASVNSALGGARPQDLIVQAPEKVLSAARDAIEDMGGVSHG